MSKKRGVPVKVVGMTFYPGYPESVLSEYPDFPSGLPYVEREADNQHDANAVAVYLPDGTKLGHLSSTVAAHLAPDMDNGVTWYVRSACVLAAPHHADRPGVELLLMRDSSSAS